MPSLISNKNAIESLLHTINCHESYIKELRTKLYRGAVTDDRIATIEGQIRECRNAILRLEANNAR
jgi:C4-type Zn-finger protein